MKSRYEVSWPLKLKLYIHTFVRDHATDQPPYMHMGWPTFAHSLPKYGVSDMQGFLASKLKQPLAVLICSLIVCKPYVCWTYFRVHVTQNCQYIVRWCVVNCTSRDFIFALCAVSWRVGDDYCNLAVSSKSSLDDAIRYGDHAAQCILSPKAGLHCRLQLE